MIKLLRVYVCKYILMKILLLRDSNLLSSLKVLLYQLFCFLRYRFVF